MHSSLAMECASEILGIMILFGKEIHDFSRGRNCLPPLLVWAPRGISPPRGCVSPLGIAPLGVKFTSTM